MLWVVMPFIGLLLTMLLTAPIVKALPFGTFDARSMAMGGVGVATGSRYASFNNPALLTTADEIHEWFVLVPTIGLQTNDPDAVEDSLTAFQQAATVLDSDNTSANRTAVQTPLNNLDGTRYSVRKNSALMVTIPSRILSGAAFFNVYEVSSAKPNIGGDDLSATTPSYSSTLAQRGLRVAENGVSAATILEIDRGWARNLAIGLNAKFLLIEGYGYTEPLRSAEVDVDRSGRITGSQFQFDIGILKELGVWKIGLVAKNIAAASFKYGDSGEKFKIAPQLRAGFAYQSRYSVLEFNIDLLENDPVGFNEPSQIASVGGEWFAWRWLAFRAGFNQNLTGNEAAYGSLGLGIILGEGIHLDVAGFSGDEGEGLSAQMGFQF